MKAKLVFCFCLFKFEKWVCQGDLQATSRYLGPPPNQGPSKQTK